MTFAITFTYFNFFLQSEKKMRNNFQLLSNDFVVVIKLWRSYANNLNKHYTDLIPMAVRVIAASFDRAGKIF